MSKIVEKKLCLSEWSTFFQAHEKTPMSIWERVSRDIQGKSYPEHVYQIAKKFILSQKYKNNEGLFVKVQAKHLGDRDVWTGDNLCLTHPHYKPDPIPKSEGFRFCQRDYNETFNAGNGRVTGGYYQEEWFEVIHWGEILQSSTETTLNIAFR